MRNHTDGLSLSNREESIERQYQQSKQRYEKYRDDLLVKLALLEENRVRSLHWNRLVYPRSTIHPSLGQSSQTTTDALSSSDPAIFLSH